MKQTLYNLSKYGVFALIAAQSPSFALIERTIDEKQPIPVILSSISHNRIAIGEGSVDRIIGDETLFSITLDRPTGQAFVTLKKPVPEVPATLTVVSRSGAVQDLHVTSSDTKPSEFVLLSEEEEEIAELGSPHSTGNFSLMHSQANSGTVAVQHLAKILAEEVPEGYANRPLTDSDQLVLPYPLKASALRALDGPFETIVVYRIKNRKKQPIDIDSETLKQSADHWIFLPAKKLKSRSETICIIASPKDRGQA